VPTLTAPPGPPGPQPAGPPAPEGFARKHPADGFWNPPPGALRLLCLFVLPRDLFARCIAAAVFDAASWGAPAQRSRPAGRSARSARSTRAPRRASRSGRLATPVRPRYPLAGAAARGVRPTFSHRRRVCVTRAFCHGLHQNR
jgi:hypothetical protein